MERSSVSASPLICQEWLSQLIETLPLKSRPVSLTVNTARGVTHSLKGPSSPLFPCSFLSIGVWRLAWFKFLFFLFSSEEIRFIRRDACGEKLASKALICIINWVVIHTFRGTEGERDRPAPPLFPFSPYFPFPFFPFTFTFQFNLLNWNYLVSLLGGD